MQTKLQYAFTLEYVTDIPAAKQFFVDVMGLQVERDNPVFVQLRDDAGSRFAIASDSSLTGSAEREIYWVVDDADTACKELSTKAKVIVPLDEKPFGKVFGIADAAGQTHFVIEFAQNRPSQQIAQSPPA